MSRHTFEDGVAEVTRPARALGEELVDAAASAILLRGFPSVTLRHVAEIAGVDVADVRATFPQKKCLVTAVVDRAAALFTIPFDAPVAGTSARERLEELLLAQLGAIDSKRSVFLVTVGRHLRPDEYPIVPPLTGGLSRVGLYFARLEEWLAANAEVGADAVRARIVGGAVMGSVFHWVERGGHRHARDLAPRLSKMLSDGMFPAASPELG